MRENRATSDLEAPCPEEEEEEEAAFDCPSPAQVIN
jgi:hypothetical protein